MQQYRTLAIIAACFFFVVVWASVIPVTPVPVTPILRSIKAAETPAQATSAGGMPVCLSTHFPQITLKGTPHDIFFTSTRGTPQALPRTFSSPADQTQAAKDLLGYGLESFEASLRRHDDDGVVYDAAAVRAVRRAFAKYREVVMFLIDGGRAGYMKHDKQLHNARYWSTLYPTLSCHDTTRVGMAPDGGRFLCNGRALGFNGRVDFVGFGSNNQWDWEEALMAQREVKIDSITTADCTVKVPRPPSSCQGVCAFKEVCLGDHDGAIPFGAVMRIGSIPKEFNVSKVADCV